MKCNYENCTENAGYHNPDNDAEYLCEEHINKPEYIQKCPHCELYIPIN